MVDPFVLVFLLIIASIVGFLCWWFEDCRIWDKVRKITGYTEKELSELNSMDYRDMKAKIMESLVSRRLIPYGTFILSAWVTDGAVFIETGVSPRG